MVLQDILTKRGPLSDPDSQLTVSKWISYIATFGYWDAKFSFCVLNHVILRSFRVLLLKSDLVPRTG